MPYFGVGVGIGVGIEKVLFDPDPEADGNQHHDLNNSVQK
jgi:hypothetical protein